ncbi:hypothetical protein MRX96_055479 [Rhipicephalus microplus]
MPVLLAVPRDDSPRFFRASEDQPVSGLGNASEPNSLGHGAATGECFRPANARSRRDDQRTAPEASECRAAALSVFARSYT